MPPGAGTSLSFPRSPLFYSWGYVWSRDCPTQLTVILVPGKRGGVKAGRKVLLGRCEMAEEYTDTGTSLASGREGGWREGKEAALLSGLLLGTHETGFWSLRTVDLKSDLATVGP